MIADGYRIFVNGCVAASFVEVTVVKNSEEISGAGYGTFCSQLNIAINFDEAMYHFEGMWLFLFLSFRQISLSALVRLSEG